MSPSCGRMTISSTVAPGEVSYAEKIDFATSSTFIKRSSGKDVPSQLQYELHQVKQQLLLYLVF